MGNSIDDYYLKRKKGIVSMSAVVDLMLKDFIWVLYVAVTHLISITNSGHVRSLNCYIDLVDLRIVRLKNYLYHLKPQHGR